MRVELGCTGHHCLGHRCRWTRHTQVGLFRISTVGDLHSKDGERRESIYGDFFFETEVFRLSGSPTEGSEGCGCLEPADWQAIEQQRYATAGEAQTGHEAMVAKYERESR